MQARLFLSAGNSAADFVSMLSSPPDIHARQLFAKEWALALLVAVLASLCIVSPFFWLGNASGHDFEFHVSSWLDVAGQWREGIAFPRWMEWANHGFGEPRFIFYPPLSWLLGAALGWFTPWTYVPVAFIFLVQSFAGLSAYALARRFLPRAPALFGALCFTWNPNALLIVYRRSDFAELLASAFFPILILAAAQVAGVIDNRCRSRPRALLLFSVLFAAVWLSNAPAGVIATYSVTLFFAWAAWNRKSWVPFFSGFSGIALGFALAGFYLVPAAYEQRWVSIAEVLSSGLQPAQNFIFTVIDDPEHTLFNFLASAIAVGMMAITGLAAIAARHSGSSDSRTVQEDSMWRALLLLAAAATLVMIRPSIFLWRYLPELRFVQFPWRWMSILSVALSFFLAGAAARPSFRRLWIPVVLLLTLGVGARLVQYAWWDPDDVPTLQAGIASGQGFDGMDEYDPLGDDHYNLPLAAPPAALLPHGISGKSLAGSSIRVQRWTAENHEILVMSGQSGRLALHLLNYPAWQVILNGAPIQPEKSEDSGQMIVPVPAGTSFVTVRFVRTADRTLGLLLSGLGVALAAFLLIKAPRN